MRLGFFTVAALCAAQIVKGVRLEQDGDAQIYHYDSPETSFSQVYLGEMNESMQGQQLA